MAGITDHLFAKDCGILVKQDESTLKSNIMKCAHSFWNDCIKIDERGMRWMADLL